MSTLIERTILTTAQLLWELNMAVAVLAVCALGLAAARLLRRHAAPLRYGLLLVALLMVVASPGGAWLAQWARLGWLQVNTDRPLPATAVPTKTTKPILSVPLVASSDLADSSLAAVQPMSATAWLEIAWWQVLGSALAAVWAPGLRSVC